MGKIDNRGYERFIDALPPNAAHAYQQIGAVVLQQWREDFSRNSRGGGDWQPVTAETVRARRRGMLRQSIAFDLSEGGRDVEWVEGKIKRFKRATKKQVDSLGTPGGVATLVNTGQLQNSLQRGNKNNIFEDISNERMAGVRIGIGGDRGQIARWHNDGDGNNPRREIATPVNPENLKIIQRLQQEAVGKAAKA